jgi:hypothetical protein
MTYDPNKSRNQENEINHSKSDSDYNDGKFPGYPKYPSSEDIYNNAKELSELDPEDLTKRKAPNELPDTPNEKDFRTVKTGDDLDVPGAELDDEAEDIGSEDEENNYYS